MAKNEIADQIAFTLYKTNLSENGKDLWLHKASPLWGWIYCAWAVAIGAALLGRTNFYLEKK